MSKIEVIAMFIIIIVVGGGGIFLAVFISMFRMVSGMFYPPVPYYPIPRRIMEANNAKGGDSQTRFWFTLTLLILLLLWMVAYNKAEGTFEPELPEWNDPNTGVMSAILSMPDLLDDEEETKPDAAVEKKENTDLYYVQFAAIADQRLVEEGQQKLVKFLQREVVIVHNGIWHFLLIGPFEETEDAKEYANSTGLEYLIKSESEL